MDKIQKAQIELLTGRGTFYASLMAQMCRVEGKGNLPEGALAAVTVQNGRIYLYTDCSLYEKFNIKQMCNIMEHEMMHIIFEHGLRCPTGQHTLWNIASDLAINSLIKGIDIGVIPGVGPFADLPVKKSAEFYFGVLKDKQDKGKLTISADGTISVDGKKVEKITCPSTDKKDDKSSDAEKLAKEVLKQAVAEAWAETARAPGGPPEGLESIIKELLKPSAINWKHVLRQYVGNAVKAGFKHSWKKPSRRFGEDQKGKMPERILEVGVAIDTSGSITDKDLAEFIGEMKGIMKSYKSKIHIVENSTQVDKTYDLTPHTKINSKFFGRGGGDHRPSFEYFEKTRKKRPDVLVYFTDGFEEFPKETRIKTIWVRPSQVADYPHTFPFGKVLQIPKRGDTTGPCPICNTPGCNCNNAVRSGKY